MQKGRIRQFDISVRFVLVFVSQFYKAKIWQTWRTCTSFFVACLVLSLICLFCHVDSKYVYFIFLRIALCLFVCTHGTPTPFFFSFFFLRSGAEESSVVLIFPLNKPLIAQICLHDWQPRRIQDADADHNGSVDFQVYKPLANKIG